MTPIKGVLVALGTPDGDDQPRALVHCTREAIQSLREVNMFQAVEIVEAGLVDALRRENERLTGIADTLRQKHASAVDAPKGLEWLAYKANNSKQVIIRRPKKEGVEANPVRLRDAIDAAMKDKQ